MRILSGGIVRASEDSCNNATNRYYGACVDAVTGESVFLVTLVVTSIPASCQGGRGGGKSATLPLNLTVPS